MKTAQTDTTTTDGVNVNVTSVTLDDLKWDERGLIAAIVQHADTGDVLMLGHMNAESLRRTLAGPHVVFWSRSRNELWEKGATSGNYLNMVAVTVDCDGDAVLVRALPDGPTCHTGEPSCFFRPLTVPGYVAGHAGHTGHAEKAHDSAAIGPEVLGEVATTIAARRREMPEGSYTTYLFREGVDKIAKKVGEEAAETIIGAKNAERGDDPHAKTLLAGEVADLFYHALVLLEATDVPLEQVWDALAHRRGSAKGVDAAPNAPKPR